MPAFPLDAHLRSVTVNNRPAKLNVTGVGDVQRAELRVDGVPPTIEVVFAYDEATDVYIECESLKPGARSEGLRIIHSRADTNALRLTLKGLGGRSYPLRVRTPRRLGETGGATVQSPAGQDPELRVTFQGPQDAYVRRELAVPLYQKK